MLRTLIALSALVASCSQTPKAAPVTDQTDSKPAAAATTDAAKVYQMQCDADLDAAKTVFARLEAHSGATTIESVLEPLNELGKIMDRGANDAALLRNAHPDDEVRAIADHCQQEFEKLSTNLGLSRPVYDAVAAVDVTGADEITKRHHAHLLRDFRRAGVDKDEATRTKIRALREELTTIGQTFGKNIRQDVRKLEMMPEALAGLPKDYVDAHQPNDAGKVTISTDYPDYIPFMTYAHDDAKRLALYTLFRKRGYPANDSVLKTLLEKRYELAQLLGYENWAAYITEDKMIKNPENAARFIERVSEVSEKRAQQDYDVLLARLKKIDPEATEVGDWQKSYLEELVKRDTFAFDSQEARKYFPYAKVEAGILNMASKMFGVQFERLTDAKVWHPSVSAYAINSDGKTIGRFFLDMHPRENKYKHAAAFPLRSGIDGVQVPEAALLCNFPGGDDPNALMEHGDVETFMHEFGHLIHHLFGGQGQRWVDRSGFKTEWDFVEAPSQLLEEWAWNAEALKTFAATTDGQVIPDALIEKMQSTRDFGKGLWVRHQMFYAALSLNYYNRNPEGIDTTAVAMELQNKYSPFDYVDDTYFQYSFGHLDGYSAIYYTYMWSLVIAKDMFSVFRDQGMLNPEAAHRYREYILAPGGSIDAAQMVKGYLGRDYSFDAFAAWLNGEG